MSESLLRLSSALKSFHTIIYFFQYLILQIRFMFSLGWWYILLKIWIDDSLLYFPLNKKECILQRSIKRKCLPNACRRAYTMRDFSHMRKRTNLVIAILHFTILDCHFKSIHLWIWKLITTREINKKTVYSTLIFKCRIMINDRNKIGCWIVD